MKHRGPIAGPRPLPDPNGPGEVEALIFDARREIKEGTRPDQLLQRWLFRNTVTAPAWPARKLENIFNAEILNSNYSYQKLWDHYHNPTPPKLDPFEEFAFEESKQRANVQCKRVMELLDCSYSRAYAIMTNGTAKPAQAKILAASVAGTTESEWMRPALPPGRKPPPVAPAIKALRLAGCSLFDFLQSLARDSKLERLSEAVAWLKAAYRSDQPPERHFDSFVQFKKALPPAIDFTDAERVWDGYKVWRVARITEALEADLLDSRS